MRIHELRHEVLSTLQFENQLILNKRTVMMLKILILIAVKLLQISNNSSIQPTSVTDISLPQGSIVNNHDYVTLFIAINTTNLFAESQKVCQSSRIFQFLSKSELQS